LCPGFSHTPAPWSTGSAAAPERRTSNGPVGDVPRATRLLRKIARRISVGTRRLTPALLRMYRLIEKGDIEGARNQMEKVLAVEVVPLYRNIASGELEKLEELKR